MDLPACTVLACSSTAARCDSHLCQHRHEYTAESSHTAFEASSTVLWTVYKQLMHSEGALVL